MSFIAILGGILGGGSGITSPHRRAAPRGPLPLSHFAAASGPEQYKLAVSPTGMRLQWVTPAAADSTVSVGTDSDSLSKSFSGTVASYSCTDKRCGGPYSSGQLHSVHLTPLRAGAKYYYQVAGGATQSFTTPPAAAVQPVPVQFGLVGDLGQTQDSNSTVHHLMASGASTILHAGDLSYADCEQPRWDTYAQLVDPLASRVPWMTVAGNHEEETTGRCGGSMNKSFAAYNARYGALMPFAEAGSSSSHYYSFETAGVHVVMLGSYIDYVARAQPNCFSPIHYRRLCVRRWGDNAAAAQLAWLKADLAKVNRTRTPWLVGVLHAPWYNSNTAHQEEHEEAELRDAMESLMYDARMDLMFAGHVHAYERSRRVYRGKADACAPTYINIGDGGNREGLAAGYLAQPAWSAYREASFGHGILSILDATHASWTWHRDEDGERVVSDSVVVVRSKSCESPAPASPLVEAA